MTLVHLPGMLGKLLDQGAGFVGSAEGLVFLSGLILGISSSKKSRKTNFSSVCRQQFRRAARLYVVQCGIVLSLILLANFSPFLSAAWQEFILPSESSMMMSVISTFLSLYHPRYLDILNLFLGFFVLSPLAIYFCLRNQHRLIIIISGVVWLISQFYDPIYTWSNLLAANTGLYFYNQSPFIFFAWQFLFVIGIVCGSKHQQQFFPIISLRRLLIACAIVAFIFSWRHGYIEMQLSERLNVLLVAKRNLGFARILDLLAIAYLLRYLAMRFPQRLRLAPLSLLGRYPLQVYCWHVVILYMTAPLRTAWHFQWTWQQQAVTTLIVLFVLTLAAWLHQQMSLRPLPKIMAEGIKS